MERDPSEQRQFLTVPPFEAAATYTRQFALGGTNEYNGKELKKALGNPKIQDEHFDEIVGHISETLAELGVDE